MAGEQQQEAVDRLQRALESLERLLQSAPRDQQPDIARQIASTRRMLESAKRDLAECLDQNAAPAEQTQVIPVEVSVEVQYSGAFVGTNSDREHFSQQLTLIGSGDTRVATMGSFTIKRAAQISVTPGNGDFTASTGAMALSGTVEVSFAGVRQRGQVTLTTEHASSPSGKYAAGGRRLDSSTLALVLVGAGAVTVSVLGQDLTYEYLVTATCVLATPPAASSPPAR